MVILTLDLNLLSCNFNDNEAALCYILQEVEEVGGLEELEKEISRRTKSNNGS